MATTQMTPLPSTFGNVGHMMQKSPKSYAAAVGASPHNRVNHYGIEVVDKIVWQGWEPGREYTKNIVLKNVKVKTEKIRYKVPESRFFTTLYPKPIILSAGTSFTLPVTFRPLEKNVYEDKILFRTNEGDFEVPIKAILPQTEIKLPDILDFQMCAAKDSVQFEFDVQNIGDVETYLFWDVKEPFTILPADANLPFKGSCQFKATFKPTGAIMYKAEAVCRYGKDGKLSKVIHFQGIGKYPHLLVSLPGRPASSMDKENLEAVIQFGTPPIGTMVTKWVELHNLVPVRVPFHVERIGPPSRIDMVFSCPQKEGIVPPMSAIKIPLLFRPNTVGTTSIDYFNIAAIGNISKSIIKCVGSSKGPQVQLTAKTVNFMQIDIGQCGTRTIDIVNNSDMDATYQFVIDCNESVFKFDNVSGVLKPESRKTLILKFYPQHPINYYRRVTCLVHNQDPLFLDLLGTCHSEMVKPAVLLAKHVSRYRVHVEQGFTMYPPEQLNELVRDRKLAVDKSGTLLIPKTDNALKTEFEGQSLQISPMKEYFNDGFHCDVVDTVPHVSTDINMADFGNCQSLKFIEDKTVNLTNHTKGKITVQWMGDADRVFSVFPSTMDIPPLKSCSFRVSFKPNVPNQFFGAELECFVYYKSLRDYRLVEDSTFCPPWCVTVTCTGHTFMPHNESFLPRYTFDSPHVIFPAVNAKESAYRTICLTNTGTTPIQFDFEKDTTCTFAVKPAKGLLKEKHQIFVVKSTPNDVKTYIQKLTLSLNDNEKYNQVIQFSASAESAEVLLDTDGVMYFKPTCVGTASSRAYSIRNISRIPLRFEWKLRYADSHLLRVHPDSGIIQPNESQSQIWSFAPKSQEKFVMKPSLVVWGQGFSSESSGGKKRLFSVRAIGQGAVGEIKVDQNYFDFGDIVVGSSNSHMLTIYNNSSCSLYYRLLVNATIDGVDPQDAELKDAVKCLELDTEEGVLAARSRQRMMVTVRPISRVTYQFTLSYQLLTPEVDGSQSSASEAQHLCHVFVTGVYPVMSITDARCFGSAVGISKKLLWNLFSLDKLNVFLDSDPSSQELRYNMATRHSHQRRPSVYTRAILDFNFSAAPLGTEACNVTLMFENTGTVPTTWAFLFPCDLQLELEYWSETGEYDEDELHEMKVMDNGLFSIEPKQGKLAPGECRKVTLTYRHTMAGTDRLPVLLKLAGGREILLNFIGVTVESERRYIHFPSNKHMFTPVPIGEKTSPKQIYELYNGGAAPVQYEFDLTSLKIIQQENFDQPVFECLNPSGEILPGRTILVEWRFSPLEAKTYMVDVPIRIADGDTAVITFTGVGFDKRVMGDTMPLTDQPDLSGVPSVQSVTVPGQLLYLSHERVSFGNMPLYSKARQMLFLMNRSTKRPVSFEWHVSNQADSKVLHITPIRGHLQPGEMSMCRVLFIAMGEASFYDLDLICEVTDEYEMGEYRRKLKEWEDEKERQKVEFIITEDDLDADKRIPNEVEITRPDSHLSSRERSRGSCRSEKLTRYKTLPPIQVKSADEEKCAEEQRKKTEKELWVKPVLPRPFLLHLGLTVRTHDVEDFQSNFPDEYNNFYIDRVLSESQEKSTEKSEEKPATTLSCKQAEANVVGLVLSNVLRGLLDDSTFCEAVKKVIVEPIPYFCQFRSSPESVPPSVISMASLVSPVSPHHAPLTVELALAGGEVAEETSDVQESPEGSDSDRRCLSSVSLDSGQVKSPSVGATSSARSLLVPSSTKSRSEVPAKEIYSETKLKRKNFIKKSPDFGNVVESIFENTILNIMAESFGGEFSITSRPRFVALPKRSNTSQSAKLSLAQLEH
ncbi:cilia- and flagella-associated protein 65-like [Gigantopelta aegis]|uniref:cilia- and flagella-associated protein 65-like n=1 Tax=Gigantopelta aegis TaxID=1735272 RepID=UPI001B88A85A|nr:cilia- and flagella-associated protein 65-like [Gigantopelta aegis]